LPALYNGNCGCKKFYFQAEIQYSDLSGGFKMSTVRDLLKVKGSQVWFVSPTADMLEPLKIIAEKGVGALLVVEGEEIKGIV
jgi:predicted transcriptional regulator